MGRLLRLHQNPAVGQFPQLIRLVGIEENVLRKRILVPVAGLEAEQALLSEEPDPLFSVFQ